MAIGKMIVAVTIAIIMVAQLNIKGQNKGVFIGCFLRFVNGARRGNICRLSKLQERAPFNSYFL